MQELVEWRHGRHQCLLESAVLHALAFGGDVDEVVFDVLGGEGDFLDVVFGEQDRLDGVDRILEHLVWGPDGSAFVVGDLFLELLDGLVLVLERDSDRLVFDDAFDATHVFQCLGQVAVERHVFVVLTELFRQELPPEVHFLLGVELPLHHVDVHDLGLGSLHDARLLVEGPVVLQVHPFPHQECPSFHPRVVEVAQELLRVCRDLFHHLGIHPVIGNLLVPVRNWPASIHEGAVVRLHPFWEERLVLLLSLLLYFLNRRVLRVTNVFLHLVVLLLIWGLFFLGRVDGSLRNRGFLGNARGFLGNAVLFEVDEGGVFGKGQLSEERAGMGVSPSESLYN